MPATANPAGSPILVVRLGAMGDIVHALPAVASLKRSFPDFPLIWAVEAKWAALLEGNPYVDHVAPVRRDSLRAAAASVRQIRRARPFAAVDLQGLIKSAVVAFASGAASRTGFAASQCRERAAALLYTRRVCSPSVHVVDRNLDVAVAAGATSVVREFPLPPGFPEGNMPSRPFVLASPLAGWTSKQWPLENYREIEIRLRAEMGMDLVLNGPPGHPACNHVSGLPGLIWATRRAAAVIGVDSGPLHLAAALNKPGVAIFGPTDPARNGPYGHSLRILRAPAAGTSYRRGKTIDSSMRQITPAQVIESLRASLRDHASTIVR